MSEVHARLKTATATAHVQVERRARVVERLQGADQGALVAGFYALHAEVEAAAAPWLHDHPALGFETRRRTPLLRKSLDGMGVAPPPVNAAVTAANPAQALGLMYVVEGSTLGGKVIRKALAAGGGSLAGMEFLDPYGDATGAQWRAFLAVLDDIAQGDLDAAVDGALQGFRLAEQHLCDIQ
jgi:heme oxygenase